MNEIRDRLLQRLDSLSKLLSDRQVVDAVSERLAEWLTTADGEPTCSVRVRPGEPAALGSDPTCNSILITASKEGLLLQLTIYQPSFQVNDPTTPVFGEHRIGPSIGKPESPASVVIIPLSEIFRAHE